MNETEQLEEEKLPFKLNSDTKLIDFAGSKHSNLSLRRFSHG